MPAVTPESHPHLAVARRASYVAELDRIRSTNLPESEWMDRLNRLVRKKHNSTDITWMQIFGNPYRRRKYKDRPHLPFLGTVGLWELLRAEVPGYKP
jgi:hypothetical protein